MTATDTVNAFIGHLNALDYAAAFALLSDDIVYHNIPMSPVVGPASVKAVFDQISATAIDWIVHASAEHDGHVLNERTDRFRLPGGRWVELRVMGSFEVLDGRITAWRDYFDLGQWMAQMAPAG
jgi:limonene-1,2-epoxide hydrolase